MGLSQADLADKAGVSLRSVQNWESGDQIPTGNKLHKICTALDTDISYFYPPGEEFIRESGEPYQVIDHPTGQAALDYMRRFIATCNNDPSRLGWLLIELRERFPLNKWGEEKPAKPLPERIAGTSFASTTPAARAALKRAGEKISPAPQESSQSPATDEPSAQKPEQDPTADKG